MTIRRVEPEELQLFRSTRPGYRGEIPEPVSREAVDKWISDVKTRGVQSIICLLAEDQLGLYDRLGLSLPEYYAKSGFSVAHIPVRDRRSPPLTETQLGNVWAAYQKLPKPVLVHCSAGIDRTGSAVEFISYSIMKG